MQRALVAVALLALSACASAYVEGRREFSHGMYRLHSGSPYARGSFHDAEASLGYGLAHERLTHAQRVAATSLRARALIELGRHDEARDQLSVRLEAFDPAAVYEGDPLGVLLLRAHALEPQRAFPLLLLAERAADTGRSRLHVAWAQAHLLAGMGTEKAKVQARKVCERHAGDLDFDDLKKRLGPP